MAVKRRNLFGAGVGLAGLGLGGRTNAEGSPTPSDPNAPIDTPIASGSGRTDERQPAALDGTASGTEVSLPKLFAASEVEGSTPNLDPPGHRLGVAVVGLGHLSLGQILPGFGTARRVRLAALVSGSPAKRGRSPRSMGCLTAPSTTMVISTASVTTARSTSSMSCCRTRCMPSLRCARRRRASTCCARSRWRPRSPTRNE